MAKGSEGTQNEGVGCIASILFLIVSILAFIKGYTSVGWLILIPILLLNLISFLRYSKGLKRNKEGLMKQLDDLKPETSSFRATQEFTSSNFLTKIAVDEEKERICIWGPQDRSTSKALAGMPYTAFEYDYSDILAVEMSEDGVSLGTKVSETETARNLLDGFISPVDGTFIGGSRPADQPKKHVDSLDLTIVVNHQARPLHFINFYKYVAEGGQAKLKKDSAEYKKHMNALRHWYMLMSFIIEKGEGNAPDG
ncbi:hypothetical protein ACFSCZ_19070 [Siminovitchia sediminis]|uniref:Uncharacterized protein n=1 Tax=Siminovitchia sediminis TaxID=1274353 RepID=A0ABW4KLA1_9BACI